MMVIKKLSGQVRDDHDQGNWRKMSGIMEWILEITEHLNIIINEIKLITYNIKRIYYKYMNSLCIKFYFD